MIKWICALALAALLAGGVSAEPPAPGVAALPYYVVFLRPNPARKPITQAERERIQAAHMANIHRMADGGILAAAGPMEDQPTTISGLFFFKAPSLEEARRIAALDPTVAEGRNTVDVHPWRGPEGLGDNYFKWKKEHPEAEDVMAAHALCLLLRRTPSSENAPPPDKEHEAFMAALRGSGALAAAGTIDGDPTLAGLVIFKTDSFADAKHSIEQDPAVASGRLIPEFHRWWSADRVLPW
jgi:uncharacterized protein YciI